MIFVKFIFSVRIMHSYHILFNIFIGLTMNSYVDQNAFFMRICGTFQPIPPKNLYEGEKQEFLLRGEATKNLFTKYFCYFYANLTGN